MLKRNMFFEQLDISRVRRDFPSLYLEGQVNKRLVHGCGHTIFPAFSDHLSIEKFYFRSPLFYYILQE